MNNNTSIYIIPQITSKCSILPTLPPYFFNLLALHSQTHSWHLDSYYLLTVVSYPCLLSPFSHLCCCQNIFINTETIVEASTSDLPPYPRWLFIVYGGSSWSVVPGPASLDNLLEMLISEPHPSLNEKLWWWGPAFPNFSKPQG